MKKDIYVLKGVHPGILIGQKLCKRKIDQKAFADSIGVSPRVLNTILTGRRNLTVEMALKIEKALGYEEGSLLIAQIYYEIAEYKGRITDASVNGTPAIRRELFWNADFDQIKWARHKEYVIATVVEFGNETDKQEIARFYDIDPATLDQYKPTLEQCALFRAHIAEAQMGLKKTELSNG